MKRYGVVISVENVKGEVLKLVQVRRSADLNTLKSTLAAEMMVLLDSLGVDATIEAAARDKGLTKDTKKYAKFIHDGYDEKWAAVVLDIEPNCKLSDASCINMMNKQLAVFNNEYCFSCALL